MLAFLRRRHDVTTFDEKEAVSEEKSSRQESATSKGKICHATNPEVGGYTLALKHSQCNPSMISLQVAKESVFGTEPGTSPKSHII